MRFPRKHYATLATVLFDLFLLWGVLHFAMGGWQRTVRLLPSQGLAVWLELLVVICLTLLKSDSRKDVPLFLSAFALAYWGEWWGTTRGVWAYATRETPPIYVVFTWGVCLLTVYHLYLLLGGRKRTRGEGRVTWIQKASFFALPAIGLALTWKGILRVDWARAMDVHVLGGVLVTCFLILEDFDWHETFWLFLCGTLLGALYEYMGTATGNWQYATGEGMPILIAPLWGMACVAMVKLGLLVQGGFLKIVRVLPCGMRPRAPRAD
ncbi:MAG: hypothetical protein AB1640_23395 [bacterium]